MEEHSCRFHLRSRANYEHKSYTTPRSNSYCPLRAMEWSVKKIITVYWNLYTDEKNPLKKYECAIHTEYFVHQT